MFEAIEAESEKILHGAEEAIDQAKDPMDYFISINSEIL